MTPAFLTTHCSANGWHPASAPPEIYDLVVLLFSDGRMRRGTWNGKLWWSYDERQRRSRAVQPLSWKAFSS